MTAVMNAVLAFRTFDKIYAWAAALFALAVGAIAAGLPAAAQTWPTRHITAIVPFGPGSGMDIVGRILVARMSETLGQQVIIENIGGAGGSIAVSRAAKAEPDGYTIVLGGIDTFAQAPALYKALAYNPATDFVPILLVAEQPLVLAMRRTIPVEDLKGLADYMRANRDKMQFGSTGLGSAPHLACTQLTAALGTRLPHVTYRSSAPGLQDMITGNLDLYCPLAASVIPLLEAKSIKVPAVLSQQRSSLLPEIPTAAEQGYKDVDGYYWIALFAPKGAPALAVARLAEAADKAIDAPATQTRLRDVGTTIMPPERRSAAYLQRFLVEEIAKWAVIIKASGVAPN